MNALPHQRFQNGNGTTGAAPRLALPCNVRHTKRSSTIYLPLAAQLADLLGRLRASDDRIEHMNAHALPRGCGPLLVAELVARRLDGFVQNSVNVPRIVRRVQLPAFECSRALAAILERRRGEPDVSRHLRTGLALCLKDGRRSLRSRLIRHLLGRPSSGRDTPSKTEAALDQAGHDSEAWEFGRCRRYSGHAVRSSDPSIRRE